MIFEEMKIIICEDLQNLLEILFFIIFGIFIIIT